METARTSVAVKVTDETARVPGEVVGVQKKVSPALSVLSALFLHSPVLLLSQRETFGVDIVYSLHSKMTYVYTVFYSKVASSSIFLSACIL